MKTRFAKILSVVLILCLVFSFASTVSAETISPRASHCPGSTVTTRQVNYLQEFPVPHGLHLDYETWNVTYLEHVCSVCGVYQRDLISKNDLVLVSCPGGYRAAEAEE